MPFSTDPVTRHAERVLSGEFLAGPHVRDACARHMRDLESGHERGLTWHPDEVERVLTYFRSVLTVEVETEDEFGETVGKAVPFEPHETQAFILGSLFGWRNAKGHRRFRRAYVEEGKGSGKSPLAAGIGMYMMTATRKLRAEVYSAATDKDQAGIMFADAVAMYERSPELRARLTQSGITPVTKLTVRKTGSFFKPISSEKKGKSGFRPYCALIDEIHEHPDNSVIEMLRAGTKGNQQALIFEITNSGADRESVCWNEHVYSCQVACGEVENDAWFSYVCALDEDDDPFTDEACWQKANPLLGVSIHPEFIREQVNEAKGMPSKENLVRRLHFCQWTDSVEGWISRQVWDEREAELDIEDYAGRVCYGGLDLSFTRDLTALAAAFPDPDADDRFDVFLWFFKARDTVAEAIKSDNVPYDLWAKDGYLELTDGKVIRLEPVAQKLGWLADTFDLQTVAYDAYRHRELDDRLADLGFDIPMTEHPQGFRRASYSKDEKQRNGTKGENPLWMPKSFETLENAIIEGRIRFAVNPVLRWNAASAVVKEDTEHNRIFDKKKSRARIDGVVAAAMALGVSTSENRVRYVTGGVHFL